MQPPPPVSEPGSSSGGRLWSVLRTMILGSLALGIIASVVVLGWHRAIPPRHCPEGLTPLADPQSGHRRCCGQGQQMKSGRCEGDPLRCAKGMDKTARGCVARRTQVPIVGGRLVITASDWEAEARVVPRDTMVAGFSIDSHEAIEADWQDCVDHGACPDLPLSGEPGRPVVGVTAARAETYCRFRGGSLPTSDQLAFAARGDPGRRYPWGLAGAICRRAAFGLADGPCGWGAASPELAGSRPSGATPEGVHDLAGNVAEWARRAPTSSDGSNVGASTTWEVRGGSWRDAAAAALRTWAAIPQPPETQAPTIGFRCAYPPTSSH